MFHLLTKKLLLLFGFFCVNKLLTTLFIYEDLIILYFSQFTSTQRVKKILFHLVLIYQYQSVVKNRFNHVLIIMKLRGLRDILLPSKTCFNYLYCVEITIEKLLFYSFIFSECLFSKKHLILVNFVVI